MFFVLCSPEAAEVGGQSGRLDARPRRQDHAQEEERVRHEEELLPGQEGGQGVRRQEEQEVAASPTSSFLFERPGVAVLLPEAV